MNIPSYQEKQIRFFNDIYKDDVTKASLQDFCTNLDRGTKVLGNETECIKYIARYGGHHFHKLYTAYASTKFENIKGENIEIIDWGCGQALATCVLIDYLIENNIDLNVSSITLVDPSEPALQRGCSLIRQMFQNDASVDSMVRQVNKYIDNLTTTDFVSETDSIKIHLFSNIIDLKEFDLKQLHQLIIGSFRGRNRVICVSPDNPKKQRLEDFYNLFLESHEFTVPFTSSEEIFGVIFYDLTGKYEKRRIGRCEKQFTVNLT